MSLKISLLKNQNYLVMPWKNGRGFTSEIAIYPVNSTLKENNFSWRLSSAEVSENGPFSGFPGCERYLAVIQGEGLYLRFDHKTERVTQNSLLKFSGEDLVESELLNGKIKDLNFIVKKNKHDVQCEISTAAFKGVKEGCTILFVIEGSIAVENQVAEKFDTVILETEQDENQIRILPAINSKFVKISIF